MRKPIYFLCMLLAACDGGGSERESSGPCFVGNTDGTYLYVLRVEAEPNNVLSMPNRIDVPAPGPTAEKVAVFVGGTLHDTQDPVDTIALTASRTIGYFFKLCEPSCNSAAPTDRFGVFDSLDPSIAYFDLLDAGGDVLMSTRFNNPTENYLEMCVDRGVTLYIMVVARDTNNEQLDYKITAFETS